MKNRNLLCYIFGIVTGMTLIPVIEEMTNLIMSWVEVMKIKPSTEISKWNEKMLEENGKEDTFVVGFEAPNYDEEYDDDYDE